MATEKSIMIKNYKAVRDATTKPWPWDGHSSFTGESFEAGTTVRAATDESGEEIILPLYEEKEVRERLGLAT
jgi:hypothetical protein